VTGSAGAPAVEATGLQYSYPAKRGVTIRPALAGVGFAVQPGEVFGFLGPNGGGKSTLFRILATLVRPDAGSLHVFGADLATRAREIRRGLGVVFQSPSLDLQLTVRENLVHQGHLYGLRGRDLAGRIAAGLERFGLAERAGQRAKELSGGLRRRAEIAKALLHAPRLLLLDEPSTGLDPGARRDLWETLAALRGEGVTVLLTTHFMEEGDRCGRLALLSRGTVVAEGTPAELKGEIGGDVITLTGLPGMPGLETDPEALARDLAALHPGLDFQVRDGAVRLEHAGGHELAARLAGSLPGRIGAVTVARPTLEDVFLRRTGHRLYEDGRDETTEAAA
jgi:ABC-2 type transport system ATP-binding protein